MVRTRIAPSPTGADVHVGSVATALMNYAWAKKNNGQFIIRIEDTDRTRIVEGGETQMLKTLKKIGLIADESPEVGGPYKPYRQSERLEIYKKYTEELVEKGKAYYCVCSPERLTKMREEQQAKKLVPKYDRQCFNNQEEIKKKIKEGDKYVIRLLIPEGQIKFNDVVRGEITIETNNLDDQVLIKSDGFPTYHMGVVVDDYLMKITHVFRGTEWLPSTPKHILLYKFLGWEDSVPKYAHLPLLLDPEGAGKLSKRKGHASVDFYKQEGYLPEAVLNFLANIVWNHPDGQEIFTLKEFEKAFELEPFKMEVKSQGARFDIRKLEWMNGEYIRKMPDEELTKRLQEFLVDHPAKDRIAPLVPLIKERIKKLSDFIPLTDFLFEKPEYDLSIFEKLKIKNLNEVLNKVFEDLKVMEKPWKSENFEKTFRNFAEKSGLKAGDVFQLIRVAVSGQIVTPPLFESVKILGEDEVIERVNEALVFLKSNRVA